MCFYSILNKAEICKEKNIVFGLFEGSDQNELKREYRFYGRI
jgi:hypothetical protein